MSLINPEAIKAMDLGQLRNPVTRLGLSADANGSGRRIKSECK